MKKFYFVFLFLAISFGYGQNLKNSGDIEGLSLYPNPVTGDKIFVSTTLNTNKYISIFDVLGTQVLNAHLQGKELDLSRLDKGVYIMRIVERDKVATRKLIIK